MTKGNCTKDINTLLAEGFTRKFADFYLNGCKQEDVSPIYEPEYREWCHSHGFFCEHASIYGLTDENIGDYLSDYDFYKVWPLNDWSRIWINDKLTLKLMLPDSEFSGLMPKYYYYSTKEGLKPICENISSDASLDGFLDLLRKVGEMACKPNNGTMAKGFFLLSFKDGVYSINGTRCSESDISSFVKSHPNYIFTEFIRPGMGFEKISSLIHTCRLNVMNPTGCNPIIFSAYMRFAESETKSANYFSFDGINSSQFHVQTDIDLQTGALVDARLFFPDRTESIERHPVTGAPLHINIPMWDVLCQIVLDVARKFNLVEYMGLDIGITNEGFKLMEINSHPGMASLQCYHPWFKNPLIKAYYMDKLNAIGALSPEEKHARNNIVR